MTENIQNTETSFLEQRFQGLQNSLDKHGNLPLSEVLSNHPFPVYQATMDRFEYTISRLPESLRKSPGISWKRFGNKVSGVMAEIGIGVADFVWDTATGPINIFFPSLRHPFFKNFISNEYMPSAVRGQNGELFFTSAGLAEISAASYSHND